MDPRALFRVRIAIPRVHPTAFFQKASSHSSDSVTQCAVTRMQVRPSGAEGFCTHLVEHTKKSAAASFTEQRSRSLSRPGVPHRNIALRGHRRSVSAASIAALGSVSAAHTHTLAHAVRWRVRFPLGTLDQCAVDRFHHLLRAFGLLPVVCAARLPRRGMRTHLEG